MSRLQYDQFVDDDEDECCPLCVEEFDLSDRNFRPCPCGYQICQFCYNNIKTTMNGLCPACRRPYDDSTIEFKNITPEEMAKHKQQIAQKAKKNAQIRQKEAQKAEADSLSRKHLAGLRVVQKNLVYVTGLTPTIREDRLLDTLRGPDYFGQYGKIIKIVVSKARENAQHQQSVGVYVTFARKEDAEACITAVDGSQNGERVLRAQYGTTKYCSAYLRGEQCNNRNCMFLHEPGEDNESFTRQDLSMMNSIQTQQPAQSSTSRSAPPAHPGPPVSAAITTAAAPMSRQHSNEGSSPTQDAPGLPATAGWASKAALERRASRSTIASHPSPMVQSATPAQASKAPTPAPKKEEPPKVEEPVPKPKTRKEEKKEERKKEKAKEKAALKSKNASPEPKPVKQPASAFEGLLRTICNSDFKFVFSSKALSEEDFKAIMEFPQLLDPNGGAKRRAMREKEQELLKQREAEAQAKAAEQPQPAPALAEPEENETTAGGSLQLGGEPDVNHETGNVHQSQHVIGSAQQGFGNNLFGSSSLADDFSNLGLNNRALTPAQQQQLLLSKFQSGPQSAALLSTLQGNQNQQSLGGNAPGHARQSSRFNFANDGASASTNVQPVASQKIMNQQNSMMPKNASQFNQMPQHQALGGQFFTNVQGPPPGLKPTGTPPVGGTNMFAQGHGFATGGLPYGANAANRNTSELYQDLLRNGGARTADSGKRESMFPSFLNQHPSASTSPAPGLLNFPYGPSPGAYQESGSQKSKKKGKKHRHANTTSSGGGGMADMQDPSILQARFSQANMAGQGPYGQGQNGFSSLYANNNNFGGAGRWWNAALPDAGFTSLVIFVIAIALGTTFDDQATLEVDALVNDDDNEPLRHPLATPLSGQFFEQPRRSTPSIPPGFTAPAIPRALADEAASRPGSRPASRPMSRTTSSTIVPAVPVVPVTPVKPETPAKGKKGKQAAKVAEAADSAPAASSKNVPATPTKASAKATAVKTPAASEATSKTDGDAATKKPEPKEKKLTPETPSKVTVKSKAANKKAEKADMAEKPEKAEKTAAEAVTQKVATKEPTDVPAASGTPTAATKRQPPGKLDIPLAKIVEKEPTSSTSARVEEPQAKAMRIVPPTATSVPPSPAVAAPSPIKHTAAPRTLRLVSTPKVETPPAVAAPTPPLPQIPTVDKLRSRQASIASLNQPGTPASELVSDTASMTSGMISRASSPPPTSNIVGSAPVRKITKAQAKKNRQERKRQEEEKEKAENGSDVEVVQAPIIGRKKKAKKPSTTPKPVAAMASAMKEAAAKSQPASPKSATVEDEPLEAPTVASVKAQSAHNSASGTPEPEVQPDESKERRDPSAQSILSDLQKTGEVLVSALEFFKPLASTLTHISRTPHAAVPTSPPDQKIHFSQADLDALAKKRPVHLCGENDKPDSRTLITPNGKFLWGLTAELEERALSLESEIERLSGYLRFHPSSHTAQHSAAPHSSDMLPAIATALKEAGKKMPNSPTNTLTFDYKTYTQHLPPVTEFAHQPPPPVQQQTPADAGAYLNQFVLPATDNPPPNHPRPEMAAVGGTPGSGTSQISIASSGQQGTLFERAARALVEGGAVGSTDIDGVASLVPDKEGGVWLEGLQGLVGAGIPSLGSAWESDSAERFVRDLSWDSGGNMPQQQTVEYSVKSGRVSSRSVLGLEEAESVLASARKEQDALERKLGALVKRNRKAALGNVR